MPNNPRIDIGVQVDYKDMLKQMKADFKQSLAEISNNAKKSKFAADIEEQIKQINDDIAKMSKSFEKSFDEINNQTINTKTFEEYQNKVSKKFGEMKDSISGVADRIDDLQKKVGMLDGSGVASKMKKEFDDLSQSVLSTYNELVKAVEITKTMGDATTGKLSGNLEEDYKKTLELIKRVRKETEDLNFNSISDDSLNLELDKHYKILQDNIGAYRQLKAEIAGMSKEDGDLPAKRNEFIRLSATIYESYTALRTLNSVREDRTGDIGAEYNKFLNGLDAKDGIGKLSGRLEEWDSAIERVLKKSREASNQIQGTFDTFRLKNGEIHIPIDIATTSAELRQKVKDIIDEVGAYFEDKPIIAKVKLVLDGSSSKGYKTNAEIDKQQVDGQGEPAIDIAKVMGRTVRDAVRESEVLAKKSIKAIQEEFEKTPIKIKPDKDAFVKELSKMIDTSLKKISKEGLKLNVNEELDKLVASLGEVSTSLTGSEGFKFGLDADSIKRITDAIEGMAHMIQRAFGVASDSDIAAQWTAIENKFKGVAGEEGKLLKGNKEHKIAIQELAVEYKKYLDMGGQNDLSALTNHKQTVKNITQEYEKLNNEVKAAQDVLEQNNAPSGTGVEGFTELAKEKGSAANANVELGIAAEMTSKALEEEGKIAQSAAERFTELAKEKKAAAEANLELGAAAELTANALREEAEVQKEAEKKPRTTKPNKKAINEDVYSENALNWQRDIRRSLLDSGDFEEVLDAKLSQGTNGVVKFTASVKTAKGEWKQFVATVNSEGNISSPDIKDLNPKQIAQAEKMIKIREALAEADEGAEEATKLNRSQLEEYVGTIIEATQALETMDTKYKVALKSDGSLTITKEVKEANGEVKTFTANFDSMRSVITEVEDATGGIIPTVKNLGEALENAFDSGKFSTTVKGIIEGIPENIADAKLGDIFPNATQTFSDINEVKESLSSLFATMGKVNEKTIKIKNMKTLTADVKMANGEIRKMTVNLDSSGFARFVDDGISQFGRLREAAEGVFKGIQSMVRIYLSPQDFVRYFRQGFDAVREMDTAMTELRKVSDASPSDITAYFGDAVASAKELGSSVNEMIGATADWQRMGYNLPDSRQLGEVAILYKNVGDGIDVDTANESLVSTIQGFQLQAKDAMSVIDAFNEVSNNYAINSGGIGEALKRSAAAFNAANTDLNQSIALITAGNEIVQSPEKVGTMWQTVSARIRGTKSELEELGEDTENVLSSSKLRSLVMGYTNVDIMKDKDTYKDIYTIVSEIGEKWKDLDDIQRAALLEGLAGKKQSNTLAAVLNNADRLKEIYETAEGSAGSARKEQERYTKSLQYSVDQLTAHGEEFWSTFINKDDVKTFINNLNIIISGATKLVDIFGSIPSVAGILGGFAAIKNVGRPKMFGLKIVLNCRQL